MCVPSITSLSFFSGVVHHSRKKIALFQRHNDRNTFTSPVVFDNDLLYKKFLLLKFTAKNRVIIFKADVPLPQAYVTIDDFGYHV
jgi:hypothetical protein